MNLELIIGGGILIAILIAILISFIIALKTEKTFLSFWRILIISLVIIVIGNILYLCSSYGIIRDGKLICLLIWFTAVIILVIGLLKTNVWLNHVSNGYSDKLKKSKRVRK